MKASRSALCVIAGLQVEASRGPYVLSNIFLFRFVFCLQQRRDPGSPSEGPAVIYSPTSGSSTQPNTEGTVNQPQHPPSLANMFTQVVGRSAYPVPHNSKQSPRVGVLKQFHREAHAPRGTPTPAPAAYCGGGDAADSGDSDCDNACFCSRRCHCIVSCHNTSADQPPAANMPCAVRACPLPPPALCPAPSSPILHQPSHVARVRA